MDNEQFIIKTVVTSLFFAGGSWSAEYPDAHLFTTLSKAIKVAKALDNYAKDKQDAVVIYKHYGMDNEEIVWTSFSVNPNECKF